MVYTLESSIACIQPRKKRVKTTNSVLPGDGGERARLSPAHRERGLDVMLSKSWARSRISFTSAESRDSLHVLPAGPTSPLAPPVESKGHVKEREGGTIHCNEGDMCVEDLEEAGHAGGDPISGGGTRGTVNSTRERHRGHWKMSAPEKSSVRDSGTDGERENVAPTGVEEPVIGPPQRRGSKYTSSQFSGLDGALHTDSDLQENGGGLPETSTRGIGSSLSVVEESQESLPAAAGQQGECPSSSESPSAHYQVDSAGPPIKELEESGDEGPISSCSASPLAPPPAPPVTAASSCHGEDTTVSEGDYSLSRYIVGTPFQIRTRPHLHHSKVNLWQGTVVNLDSCVVCLYFSLYSRLLSRLPPSPSPSVSDRVMAADDRGGDEAREIPSLEGATGQWSGETRAQLMSATYHKLRKAFRRGIKELQWQR